MPPTAPPPPTLKINWTRPALYPLQEQAIFTPERYAIIEASTKAGKTAGCIAWLTEQAMRGKAGHNFWWVAPIFAQAKIAFRRLKRYLPAEVYTANESELTITLIHGPTIWFKGADHPDSLYGEDVYAAVIDEASRCKEDAWHAVRSTLTATRGPIRIIGNVKGRRNWAYALARKAEAGEPGMAYAKITARDAVAAGVLDQAEIDDARRQLPEQVYRELYEAEPSDDAGNPFGLAHIAACVAPLSTAPPVAFGVDLAKSIDWTVGVGLDRERRTCRFFRFQQPWEETIVSVRRETARVPTLVDSTGVGDAPVEAMQRRGDTPTEIEGFKFSSTSKQQLMEGLAVAIQRREVTFPDGVIKLELDQFEYQYTRTGVRYSAPEGVHDDAVCALALAVYQHRHRPGQGVYL